MRVKCNSCVECQPSRNAPTEEFIALAAAMNQQTIVTISIRNSVYFRIRIDVNIGRGTHIGSLAAHSQTIFSGSIFRGHSRCDFLHLFAMGKWTKQLRLISTGNNLFDVNFDAPNELDWKVSGSIVKIQSDLEHRANQIDCGYLINVYLVAACVLMFRAITKKKNRNCQRLSHVPCRVAQIEMSGEYVTYELLRTRRKYTDVILLRSYRIFPIGTGGLKRLLAIEIISNLQERSSIGDYLHLSIDQSEII